MYRPLPLSPSGRYPDFGPRRAVGRNPRACGPAVWASMARLTVTEAAQIGGPPRADPARHPCGGGHLSARTPVMIASFDRIWLWSPPTGASAWSLSTPRSNRASSRRSVFAFPSRPDNSQIRPARPSGPITKAFRPGRPSDAVGPPARLVRLHPTRARKQAASTPCGKERRAHGRGDAGPQYDAAGGSVDVADPVDQSQAGPGGNRPVVPLNRTAGLGTSCAGMLGPATGSPGFASPRLSGTLAQGARWREQDVAAASCTHRTRPACNRRKRASYRPRTSPGFSGATAGLESGPVLRS